MRKRQCALSEDLPPMHDAPLADNPQRGLQGVDDQQMSPTFTFCETCVVKTGRPSQTFVCPTVLHGRAEVMRADWPCQEIVYFDGHGAELMRLSIDQMPAGRWMW